METETQTRVERTVVGRFRVRNRSWSLLCTEDELRAIVQQAYDRYGILAAPSYDTEATRVVPPAEVSKRRCREAIAEAQDMRRATEDPSVTEWADTLGQDAWRATARALVRAHNEGVRA